MCVKEKNLVKRKEVYMFGFYFFLNIWEEEYNVKCYVYVNVIIIFLC